MKTIDWKKYHRFQKKSGWCGPATIQMTLLSVGINKSQAEIGKDVYQEWWGTTQNITIAYLSKYFLNLGFKQNSNLKDIEGHLKKGHIVLVDWWDDFDTDDQDGHYSIIGEVNRKDGQLTLIDPSNERKGIWQIKIKEFEKRWFDTLDIRNKIKINKFFIWIDPSSKL